MTDRDARVVVMGSANVDRTIPLERMPAAGETVLGGAAARGAGGKGLNQAVAAARAGAPTAFVGAVGDDPDGTLLAGHLVSEGVDTSGLALTSGPTGLAVILLEGDGSNRIVVSPGANHEVDPVDIDVRRGDALVCQLEIPTSSVATALARAREAGAVTILNAAPAVTGADELLGLVDVLVVNEPELAALTGRPVDGSVADQTALIAGARSLLGRRSVVVTLGAAGALVVAGDHHERCPAPPVDVVDTTGAGDCFVGVLAAASVEGASLGAASAWAVAAASRSVTRPGAASSMPRRADLEPLDRRP